MPTALLTNQYELCDADGNPLLLFGTETTGYLTIDRPVHSGDDGTVADTSRPNEDNRMFGRDYRGAKSIAFVMGVLTDPLNSLADVGQQEEMNLDYLDQIEGIWTDPTLRDTPRASAILRACEAGRTTRAYGRPRKYAEVAGSLTKFGYTPITCTFDLIDDRWYSDVEQVETCTLIPSTDGGLTTPLTTPLTTSSPSAVSSAITIGATRPTWPVVTFHGPVQQPRVSIGPMTIALDTSIADGESLVFDPRPWKRCLLRSSDGASFAGSLIAPTPLMADAKLAPGTYAIIYRGTDFTGSSYVEVRWRDARSRP